MGLGYCRLNEEMIETLFVVNTANSKPKETTPRSVLPSPNQENRVLDPKKAQNIAILLRALNVTMEEVCEALLEGTLFITSHRHDLVSVSSEFQMSDAKAAIS